MCLPVGLHGFDSSSAPRPRPVHLAAQIVDGERVAALALEQDRDRRERLEDVEQLFVGV
jgi:hypothetical protein